MQIAEGVFYNTTDYENKCQKQHLSTNIRYRIQTTEDHKMSNTGDN